LANAEVYFKQHLRVGDYYTEGQIVLGQWQGEGARTLGLDGLTETDDFVKLCRNLHPETGQRLTQRQNGRRMETVNDGSERSVANRRVFYDFTLSPPKSVSIAALVGNDERIIQAHDEAVQLAFRQLEMYAATRVRKQGENSYRMTGNLVGAIFHHDTSRALDPHLHSHCIVFNATRDSVENRWKALEACEMVAAKKFAENVYYHELTKALRGFGYRIQNKARGDFEVEGVSQVLIDRFSKRHREIDEKTQEFLAREPERAQGNLKDIRENIAYKERPRKIKDIGIVRLQSLWNFRLRNAISCAVSTAFRLDKRMLRESLHCRRLFGRKNIYSTAVQSFTSMTFGGTLSNMREDRTCHCGRFRLSPASAVTCVTKNFRTELQRRKSWAGNGKLSAWLKKASIVMARLTPIQRN
jgi:conjugative relaxase-like TrwC/TraI family protein